MGSSNKKTQKTDASTTTTTTTETFIGGDNGFTGANAVDFANIIGFRAVESNTLAAETLQAAINSAGALTSKALSLSGVNTPTSPTVDDKSFLTSPITIISAIAVIIVIVSISNGR